MTTKSLRRSGFPILLPFALILGTSCAGKGGATASGDAPQDPSDATALGTTTEPSASIRFAIEVGVGVAGPIYVLLNEASGQVGWVRAFQDGERIYFRERCEIEDCANRGVVCGAALSMIKNIANGSQTGMIEFVWDGMTSVVDAVSGCETRQPAPPGDYIARFCYSREAEFDGDSDPTRAVRGRLVRPTCTDQPFTLLEQEVVLRI